MNASTLLQACRVLFGGDVVISEAFLGYLQPNGLKSVYRKRVRECHPDRLQASACGDIAAFHAVQQAYQILAVYLQERENCSLPKFETEPATPPATASTVDQFLSLRGIGPFILQPSHRLPSSPAASIDRLYRGILPSRRLLFGNFLYYCGLTTWRTITAVLVQQKILRPRFGELGTRYGMLRPEDVPRILAAIGTRRRIFGEAAMSLGMLDEKQVQTLLYCQQQQQKKFGAILVEKKLITTQELSLLLAAFRRHNRFYDAP